MSFIVIIDDYYYAPVPLNGDNAMMAVVSLSVRPSVCLSVPRLTLSPVWKSVAS